MTLNCSILFIFLAAVSLARAQDLSRCRIDLGGIQFRKNSAKLTTSAKSKLDSLTLIIRNEKNYQLIATSYFADLCDKCGALGWDRARSVLSYLSKKGIKED